MRKIDDNLYQRDNGQFYAVWTKSGKTNRISLKTANLKQAKAALARLKWERPQTAFEGAAAPARGTHLEETTAKTGPTLRSRPDFPDALAECLAHSGWTGDTLRNADLRRRTILALCKDWATFRPAAVWRRYMERGTPAVANQLRWLLRTFVAYSTEEGRGWLDQTAMTEVSKIKMLPIPSRNVQMPEPQAVLDFLSMCQAEDRQLGQFIRWIAYTGLRLQGAAGARWEEVNWNQQSIRRKMKGGREKSIPLISQAIELLREIAADQGSPAAGPVFAMGTHRIKRVRRIMRKYATGFGIDLAYPHALRHHFASLALSRGFSPGETAEMLGHQDGGVLVLRTYGHVMQSSLKGKVATLSLAT